RRAGHEARGRGERDVEYGEQRAVRVREAPHRPARLVGDVEVEADLEPVQDLEAEAERQEHEQRPPADPEMACRRLDRGARGSLRHSMILTGRSSRSDTSLR